MRNLFIALVILLLADVSTVIAADIATVDQENPGPFETTNGGRVPFGQSFTPARPGIDAMEFLLSGDQARVVLQLREGVVGLDGMSGNIIATSQEVSINRPPPPGRLYHFDFPDTVPLTPGEVYVAELATLSGSLFVRHRRANNYPGGQFLHPDEPLEPFSDRDLIFREGLHEALNDLPQVVARIDRNQRFVLNGNGHEMSSVTFASPSGSLLPAATPDPFDTIAFNTSERVGLSTNAPVVLDGDLTTSIGYNVDISQRDVTFDYTLSGVNDAFGPFPVGQGQYPPDPKTVPLQVRVDDQLQIVIEGIGQRVSQLVFTSPSGSLTSTSNATPFDTFQANTSEEVSLSAVDGVRVDGTLILPVGWTEEVPDIGYRYRLFESTEFLPTTQIATSDYPSPNDVLVFVGLDGTIQAFGRGQLVVSMEARSPSGALQTVAGDIAPFDNLEVLGDRFFYSASTPFEASEFPVSLRWDPNGLADLEFSFDAAGPRPIVTRVIYNTVVPEPTSLFLSGLATALLLTMRRVGQCPMPSGSS